MKKEVHSPQSAVHSPQSTVYNSRASRIAYLTSIIRHPASGILLFLLISCSPAKRLEHFLNHHPEFRYSDTLVLRDTITTRTVEADSSIHIERLFDTVVIEKEQLEVSLLRIQDTLYINGKCNPDTIFTETRIPVEKIKLVNEPFTLKSLKPVTWLLITLIILILILSIVKRI